jgi:glycosyltransferase involved in cell wall biosynthesis
MRTVVILTVDELEGVQSLAEALQQLPADEVLAVDGGSTDGTVTFLESLGIRVVRQERPGRGAAIRDGVDQSRGDNVVLFSPDGNEDPADIPRLFEMLDAGYDMAIASRFLPDAVNEEDASWLPARKWANQAFSLVLHALWAPRGVSVTDPINGFRAFTRRAFHVMNPQSDRFTIEYELTQRAFVLGLPIVEIPTHEGQRIAGSTKAPSIRTGISFCRFVLGQWIRGRN